MNEFNEVSANELNQIEGGSTGSGSTGWLVDKAKGVSSGVTAAPGTTTDPTRPTTSTATATLRRTPTASNRKRRKPKPKKLPRRSESATLQIVTCLVRSLVRKRSAWAVTKPLPPQNEKMSRAAQSSRRAANKGSQANRCEPTRRRCSAPAESDAGCTMLKEKCNRQVLASAMLCRGTNYIRSKAAWITETPRVRLTWVPPLVEVPEAEVQQHFINQINNVNGNGNITINYNCGK